MNANESEFTAPNETQLAADSPQDPSIAELFQMGAASVLTKGTLHGIEWNFTPHY